MPHVQALFALQLDLYEAQVVQRDLVGHHVVDDHGNSSPCPRLAGLSCMGRGYSRVSTTWPVEQKYQSLSEAVSATTTSDSGSQNAITPVRVLPTSTRRTCKCRGIYLNLFPVR